jgi:hypothetical protein
MDQWTPPGHGERYDPLPSFLMLPAHAWRKLSPRGRRITAVVILAAVVATAVAWPHVRRAARAAEAESAAVAAEHRAASLRALIDDQRPRHDALPPSIRDRILAGGGGLQASSAAGLVATRLESAIAHDVRARIANGKLEGPLLLQTTCDPVEVRSRLGADYNCFATIGRAQSGERELESGYRFSARAQLPAGTLAWCKENPRPLHPTSYVLSVPISPECR